MIYLLFSEGYYKMKWSSGKKLTQVTNQLLCKELSSMCSQGSSVCNGIPWPAWKQRGTCKGGWEGLALVRRHQTLLSILRGKKLLHLKLGTYLLTKKKKSGVSFTFTLPPVYNDSSHCSSNKHFPFPPASSSAVHSSQASWHSTTCPPKITELVQCEQLESCSWASWGYNEEH